MSDDRDRRAALDFARKSDADRWTQDDIDNLAAFRAAARAEGAAEAIEAAAQTALTYHEHLTFGGGITAEDASIDTCIAIEAGIRALAPAGLVAVSVDDLEWLLSEAETCEMRMPTSNPRLREKRDEIVTRIRAAVARKGE